MINDLSKPIDYNHRKLYIKCISITAEELDQITSQLDGNFNTVYKRAKTDVETVNDARRIAREILSILESTEKKFNLARNNFINSYHLWLSNISPSISSNSQTKESNVEEGSSSLDTNQNENIVDLEDPNVSDIQICDPVTPEIQIVNEVNYRARKRVICRNPKEVIHILDDQSDLVDLSYSQSIASKSNDFLDVESNLEQNSQNSNDVSLSLKDNSISGVVNNIKQADFIGKYLHSIETITSSKCENQENLNIECKQRNNLDQGVFRIDSEKSEKCKDYCLDERLHSGCFVQLENLNINTVQKFISHRKKSQEFPEDSAFLRLIDLTRLERKRNKRCHSMSSDSSYSSTNSTSDDSLARKQTKKQKVSSDDSEDSESDTTSYYESSDADADNNSTYENVKVSNFEKLDSNEEKAKFLLLQDSDDTSDYSDGQTDCDDNDDDKHENSVKTINKMSTGSKDINKTKSSRSSWLNDKLLKFKLPDDKTHEDRDPKDFNDSGSMSSNDVEEPKASREREANGNITEVESIGSPLPDDPQESENSCEGSDNEETINDFETSISIAMLNKIAGRRNIRAVLDDQHITENTRRAEKDEESRLQRLELRKEQLNSLLRPEESIDGNSLTLDFNFNSKEKLAAVDKGLVKLLKPHQREGIRFMWDCCFESIEQMKKQKGSGCILAHCMGLGKTLQVITLVHTLLANKTLGMKTAMIVCPTNTILNWLDEFNMWLKHTENESNIKIIELTQVKKKSIRIKKLEHWQQKGGVLIISYDSFRSFTSFDSSCSSIQVKKMSNLLLNPGADLVVCDEGHLLKNENSQIADRMQQVKTHRRIVLTGTPLQNNLDEYHCMVQFVKPNLLGTKKEFANRFANPIKNGQYDNSTPDDVKLMKHRAHVLHRLLEGCVQRCDYAVLMPLLPEKQEYVVTVRMSHLLQQLYQYYFNNVANVLDKHCSLLKKYQEIKRLVAHPKALELCAQDHLKHQKNDHNKAAEFWWREIVKKEDLEDITISYKLKLFFGLLESCVRKKDKLLVFSQCLYTLNLIELFLNKFDDAIDGEWKKGVDYFRIDSKVSPKARSNMCKMFNDPANSKARLFLISTKAGGLGINLTGGNRVVVFDPSWNPSNDLQSIFRVFRFGQEKPCYVYRFLTAGTMEEKIYIRQVMKLSLSLRVLDEQQVGRHYRDTDVTDLYKLDPLAEGPNFNRPRDDLLTEVISKYSEYVYNVFEHDSLLQNREEEELNEEERKQAWLDYQENLAAEKDQALQSESKSSVDLSKEIGTVPVFDNAVDLSEQSSCT